MSPRETAILAIESCGSGEPVWWKRDGTVVATSLHPQLKSAAARAGEQLPELETRAVSGPDATAAGVARGSRWPALAIGARPPETGEGRDETAEGSSEADGTRQQDAVAETVSFGEEIVRQLDREIGERADGDQSSS